MKRNQWEFEFSIDELLAAARKKAEYHRGRSNTWTAEYQSAEIEIRNSAKVELLPVSGGNRAELRADPALIRRHDEARMKADEHQKVAEEYEMFGRAFQLAADRGKVETLLLHAEDILYFGL